MRIDGDGPSSDGTDFISEFFTPSQCPYSVKKRFERCASDHVTRGTCPVPGVRRVKFGTSVFGIFFRSALGALCPKCRCRKELYRFKVFFSLTFFFVFVSLFPTHCCSLCCSTVCSRSLALVARLQLFLARSLSRCSRAHLTS